MAKEKRFEKIYSQDLGGIIIYVDKQTGVQYLFVANAYSGGLSPLLDKNGNPSIYIGEE